MQKMRDHQVLAKARNSVLRVLALASNNQNKGPTLGKLGFESSVPAEVPLNCVVRGLAVKQYRSLLTDRVAATQAESITYLMPLPHDN